MGAIVDIAVITAEILIAVGLYCVVCLALLFYLDLPDDPLYGYAVDAVFAVTFPFVLAMVVASIVRRRNPNA